MEIEILAFGVAKDILGDGVVRLKISQSCDVLTLKNILKKEFPELPTFMVAINTEYAFDDHPIKTGDVIALIPPTNGG